MSLRLIQHLQVGLVLSIILYLGYLGVMAAKHHADLAFAWWPMNPPSSILMCLVLYITAACIIRISYMAFLIGYRLEGGT